MADLIFLDSMNRKEKRAAANELRGVNKCLQCDLFGKCYKETKRILDIRTNHKGNGMLPKEARQLPTEICEFHEKNRDKGTFYPKYSIMGIEISHEGPQAPTFIRTREEFIETFTEKPKEA